MMESPRSRALKYWNMLRDAHKRALELPPGDLHKFKIHHRYTPFLSATLSHNFPSFPCLLVPWQPEWFAGDGGLSRSWYFDVNFSGQSMDILLFILHFKICLCVMSMFSYLCTISSSPLPPPQKKKKRIFPKIHPKFLIHSCATVRKCVSIARYAVCPVRIRCIRESSRRRRVRRYLT